MSLAPDERRTLAEIAGKLGESDPELAAMLATFRADFSAESAPGPPPRACMPSPKPRSGARVRIIVLAITVVLFIACSIVAVVVAPRNGQVPDGQGPRGGATSSGSYLPGRLSGRGPRRLAAATTRSATASRPIASSLGGRAACQARRVVTGRGKDRPGRPPPPVRSPGLSVRSQGT